MKIDTTRAWEGALKLLSSNKDVMLVVAGVFFFLPTVVVGLLAPTILDPFAGQEPQTPEQMMALIEDLPASFWIANLVIVLIQAAGVLALFRLLSDSGRPTVGEALKFGGQALPSYIGAQLLQLLVFFLLIGLPVGILGAILGAAGGFAAILLAIPAMLFLFTRFSMMSAIIGIEGQLNPLAALRQSWLMVKGNTLRLFVFYLLLFVCMIVISLIVSALLGLLLALLGEHAQAIGNTLLSGLMSAFIATIFVAVLASIHRQLASRRNPVSVPPTQSD